MIQNNNNPNAITKLEEDYYFPILSINANRKSVQKSCLWCERKCLVFVHSFNRIDTTKGNEEGIKVHNR